MHGAGVSIGSLVARLILGGIFLWAGIPKFQEVEFTAEQATRLVQLGAIEAPSPAVPEGTPLDEALDETFEDTEDAPAGGGELPEDTATPPVDEAPEEPIEDAADEPTEEPGGRLVQEQPLDEQPDDEPPFEDAEPADDPLIEPDAPTDVTAEPGEVAPVVTGPVKARMVHYLTLMLDAKNHPYPVVFAWLAAVTEVLGGALLIIGFLTRIWALGMVVTMVYAFALTSVPLLQTAAGSPAGLIAHLRLPEAGPQVTTMLLQLALFGLAWVIMFIGPGAVSLDRALFGRRRHHDD